MVHPILHTSYCNLDILSSYFDVASTCLARAAPVTFCWRAHSKVTQKMMWDWSYFSSYSFVSGTKFKAAFEKYFHCRPLLFVCL
jgi:hypothetical protein